MHKQLYVLAGFDEATALRLRDWEALLEKEGFHGRQTRGIPPHITLGTLPPEQEEKACALMLDAASVAAPFAVSFSHLGVFGGSQVLFAAPDVSRGLLELKERFGPAAGWSAHATLLIDEPERVVTAMSPALRFFKEFEGRVERLYLYEFFPARLILDLPLEGRN